MSVEKCSCKALGSQVIKLGNGGGIVAWFDSCYLYHALIVCPINLYIKSNVHKNSVSFGHAMDKKIKLLLDLIVPYLL